MTKSTWWPRIRRIWATVGTIAFVVFTSWSLLAYRASSDAQDALVSDDSVTVSHADGARTFKPGAERARATTRLLFIAGSLVDPAAYAPLARAVALAGYPATILELPRRGAFGGAEDPELYLRARGILRNDPRERWVLGGHSRGAVVATQLAHEGAQGIAALLIIGSSHPRDVSLAEWKLPITKIVGTRDGLASPEEVRANMPFLPASARFVWVEGGNHSQFGWYGFQPGDRRARISADEQRAIMIRTVLETMGATSRSPERGR